MSREQRCLGCYQLFDKEGGVREYHTACSKKLFGTQDPPIVDFGSDQLEEMAKTSLSRHLGITGVQPKLSVNLEKQKDNLNHRLMIVGLWGDFILKPPTKRFVDMSVVEDATMHMATAAGITTARHGLIRLKSGELAYVTKRFDRQKKTKKRAMEDFCQLSELLTESKYKTSMERAGKIILIYSANPGLDAVAFFDLSLFSFITGNADMHLKNFSLIANESGEFVLSPAYDLLATKLLPIKDNEETALTINGKKSNLRKKDFLALGEKLEIPFKAIENSFERIAKSIPDMKVIIANSFLPSKLKENYENLIDSRIKILKLK